MLSDILSDAVAKIRDWQCEHARCVINTEIDQVSTVMDGLRFYLDAMPFTDVPEYDNRLNALCESLRLLDTSGVADAVDELRNYEGPPYCAGHRNGTKEERVAEYSNENGGDSPAPVTTVRRPQRGLAFADGCVFVYRDNVQANEISLPANKTEQMARILADGGLTDEELAAICGTAEAYADLLSEGSECFSDIYWNHHSYFCEESRGDCMVQFCTEASVGGDAVHIFCWSRNQPMDGRYSDEYQITLVTLRQILDGKESK